jgi:hypothetical protein
MLHQISQNLEGLGPQGDLLAASAQKSAIEIQREFSERVLAVESLYEMWLRWSQTRLLSGLINFSAKYHRDITTSRA